MRLAVLLLVMLAGCMQTIPIEPPMEPTIQADACWFEAPKTPCEPGLMVAPAAAQPPLGWFCRGAFGFTFLGQGQVMVEIWGNATGAMGMVYNIMSNDGQPAFMRSLIEVGDTRWTVDHQVPSAGLTAFVGVDDLAPGEGRMRFLYWPVSATRHTPNDVVFGVNETDQGLWMVGYGKQEAYGRAGPVPFRWEGGQMASVRTGENLSGTDRQNNQTFLTVTFPSGEARWPASPVSAIGAASCPMGVVRTLPSH